MTRIFIDSDACPVKDEVYRVAGRYGLHVFVVANRMIAVPDAPLVERIVVEAGPDVADDWIAEHTQDADIVITADIPLAARCVEKGAYVLEPKGRLLDGDAIGMALAMRNLMTDLRSAGMMTPGGAPFGKADRSRFLSALDTLVIKARKPRPRPRPLTPPVF
ncbi:YaiI/YqxD family protein [Acetobacter ghanensis]|uniref:YaiI/YqxD family protein n=1 Tax=Acetobacter ghanensis TaxID=431306 RepID=UPI003D3469C0